MLSQECEHWSTQKWVKQLQHACTYVQSPVEGEPTLFQFNLGRVELFYYQVHACKHN